MDKIRFLIKSSGRKPMLIILASLLFLIPLFAATAAPQSDEANKKKIVRQVAQKWIEVGAEQFKRGYFKAAKQSFLRAQDYQEFLTSEECGKLTALLEKTQKGILEREYILEVIRTADGMVKQGRIIESKTSLEEIKDNEFLTEDEQELINKGLQKLNSQLNEQKKEYTELYDSSVQFYKAGQLEKAREGFIKIAKSKIAGDLVAAAPGETAEEYLLKIDKVLAEKAQPSVLTEEQPEDTLGATIAAITKELVNGKAAMKEAEAVTAVEPEVVKEPNKPVVAAVPEEVVPEPVVPEAAEPEETYIEVINRRRNIRRSHTSAVVNDAVAKVHNYISKDEFDKAKAEVETAERIVNEYQMDLGDEIYKQRIGELKQLNETISQEKDKRVQQLQEQKQLEAIESQSRYREQMEADRSKRMTELMDNAVAYQSQQRYVEALGQLESLIAIDPLNSQALILKQTLEDMISFRRQLEAQRESDIERVNNLISSDEAMIPYAEELTHPKNWREIIASPYRKPDEPIGRSAADAAVYKQLDEIVDLSQLTPEMPFSEAIEVIKNSVDPPLRIFVNWRDLYDNADIDQSTPINMDPISAVPLRKALELLLEAVSGGFADINFIVGGGIITIATEETLPSEMETLVYDITDLIGRPAEFYAETGGISVATSTEAGTEELTVEEVDRETLVEEAIQRAEQLRLLIQQTIQPESWFEAGGEGTITVYERKKLIIYQTREIHNIIERMLEDLRKALGHQVAIEARFLLVGENFLEDVGLDADFRVRFGTSAGGWGVWEFEQSSSDYTLPTDTGITGSWGPTVNPIEEDGTNAMTTSGSWGNVPLLLTDLDVSIMLRATQAHKDAKSLTAPKVTVLSGEMASMRVQRYRRYPFNIEIDIETIGQQIGELPNYMWTIETEEGSIVTGTLLNITPIITPDKKNVLLNIVTEMRDFLGWEQYPIQLPILGGGLLEGGSYTIRYPETEISRVETRVSVPDRATLLLGGQRITADVEREAGVPVLSKLPFLGRLFSNRSKIKDNLILLILVKPTIILREEAESKAIAAMESNF